MVCIIRSEPSAVPRLWVGVILAENERCLWRLSGRPVLDHVIERTHKQVSSLIISTSGDPTQFAGTGLPVVVQESRGPGGAILSGCGWAATNVKEAPWVATFSAAVPFVPVDLVERLGRAVGDEGAEMACAVSSGLVRLTFGLWPVRLRRSLRQAIAGGDDGALEAWVRRYRLAEVSFTAAIDPLFAVDSPEDLTVAERALVARQSPAVI
jgi:molybdopterin-guanine dinucleotide biosynthesis protein A